MAISKRKLSEKWSRIPADKIAIERGYYFDQDAADRVCNFFPRFLTYSQGDFAGKPFILADWQRECLSRAYGWMRPNGYRRFSEVFLEVPKKNGKSTMLSGVGLYGLCEEEGAEVYAGAVNSKQARIVYREAERMVAKSPKLRRNLKVTPSVKLITFPATNSIFEAMSADVESKDGLNMSHGILDEIHQYRDSKLYDIMLYAGAARKQPMLWMITTAGDSPYSFWGQTRLRAERILEGLDEDLHFLPIIYAASKEKDNLDDPEVWKRVNPSLGTIISVEKFAEEYATAKKTPRKRARFERVRLGIPEDQAMRWLDMRLWEPCKRVYDLSFFKGRDCYIGVDLSTNVDLTAISICTKVGDLVFFYLLPFMPIETAESRSDKDKVPYLQWLEEGWMIETEGRTTDYHEIRKTLNDLVEYGLIVHKIGFDPWNAQELMNNLKDDGFDVFAVRQTISGLTGPSKEFERILLNGSLRHNGNPVLKWCVGNMTIHKDKAGNFMPDKDKSTDRIDGAVASIIALGMSMFYPDPGSPSITLL